MKSLKAKEPFRFHTRLHLSELTGLKASTLNKLLELLRDVPGSSIYHHTHRFLQQHQYLSPEPPNDFAYWVNNILGDDVLGERLASIDVVQFSTIRGLREKIIETIEDYVKKTSPSRLRSAAEGDEFYFIKSISFVFPTEYVANDLGQFMDILGKITISSIYFHIFEARLRVEKGTNDFSLWIDTSLGNKKLADKINRLDPYTYTLEALRKTVINIIKKDTH